jgi:hypothetical protein
MPRWYGPVCKSFHLKLLSATSRSTSPGGSRYRSWGGGSSSSVEHESYIINVTEVKEEALKH